VSGLAEVDVQRRGTVMLATVTGEIDVFNAREIGARLQEAAPLDAHALVVDLSGLEFLDSTAIHRLFGLATMLRERRQRLAVVVGAGSAVQRTLELVGFARAAGVREDLDEVLAELGVESAG
jgi:anti-sigma B factor antagonist